VLKLPAVAQKFGCNRRRSRGVEVAPNFSLGWGSLSLCGGSFAPFWPKKTGYAGFASREWKRIPTATEVTCQVIDAICWARRDRSREIFPAVEGNDFRR